MNTPEKNNSKNYFKTSSNKFFYTALLFSILSLTHTDIFSQTNQKQNSGQQSKNIGIASTKRTIDEMETRVGRFIDKAEGEALDKSKIMQDETSVKIIDVLIQRNDEGILSEGAIIGAVFLMADRKLPNKVLRDYINKNKKYYSEKDLDDYINSCIMVASLMYIKK